MHMRFWFFIWLGLVASALIYWCRERRRGPYLKLPDGGREQYEER